jgi:ATP-binding protein involved in chromosome partitioning
VATKDQATEALASVMDPELGRSIVELGMVRDLMVEGGTVRFTLALTTKACPLQSTMIDDSKKALLALDGVDDVDVEVGEMTTEDKQAIFGAKEPEQGQAEALNDIKRVIAVMSGKGGVGKSLVAALLAVTLRRRGLRVGVLDADITGPSIPKMFFDQMPQVVGGPIGILPPESKTGIKVMSINLLLPNEDDAVIWRGPLISGAIKQFWGDVFWRDLDVLVVDLPPGTSDPALTVMQAMPVDGVLMVTTPQDLAGMVVRKASQMASQLDKPVLGLVENMSYVECPDCGKRIDVFGPSHGDEVAAHLGVPLLAQLPLDPRIAELSDQGRIEEYGAEAFQPVADAVAKGLS